MAQSDVCRRRCVACTSPFFFLNRKCFESVPHTFSKSLSSIPSRDLFHKRVVFRRSVTLGHTPKFHLESPARGACDSFSFLWTSTPSAARGTRGNEPSGTSPPFFFFPNRLDQTRFSPCDLWFVPTRAKGAGKKGAVAQKWRARKEAADFFFTSSPFRTFLRHLFHTVFRKSPPIQ